MTSTVTASVMSTPSSRSGISAFVGHQSLGGSFPVESQAAYLQDGWTVMPSLTLNVGLRWEAYLNKDGLGHDFIDVGNQWAPRVGAVWSPGGRGRQKLYASLGRYYLPVASNTNVRAAGAFDQDASLYAFDGEPDPVDGSPPGFTDCGFGATCPDQGSVGELLYYFLNNVGTIEDPRLLVADDFDPISQDEVIVGYERLVGADWSVGARVIARRFNEVIEDFTLDRALANSHDLPCMDPELIGTPLYCTQFRMGNPGQDFSGWIDLDGDGTPEPISFMAAELDYPEPVRDYYALELTFRRRFADRWMLQGAYTWSHLYGNFEGYVNSDVGQSDAGLNQTYDYPGLVDNPGATCRRTAATTSSCSAATAWTRGSSSAATSGSTPAGRSTPSASTPPTLSPRATAPSRSSTPTAPRRPAAPRVTPTPCGRST